MVDPEAFDARHAAMMAAVIAGVEAFHKDPIRRGLGYSN
jgi:hypothetical protein